MATEVTGNTVVTIGTTPELITFTDTNAPNGYRMMQQPGSGTVHIGDTSSITSSTAPRIPKGNPGYCYPYVVAEDRLRTKRFYLVGSAAGQKVEFWAG